jgi:hypothetical protein
MTRHRLPTVAVLMAALLFAVMAPAPTATAATVDTVVEWNGYATTALISQQIAPLNAPPVATLLLAMVHGAVYDAVNAIDGGYQPTSFRRRRCRGTPRTRRLRPLRIEF